MRDQEPNDLHLSDIDSANNLVELFLARADAKGDAPFLGVKRGGAWQTISWREAAAAVCILAENLHKLGLETGDRVMLVSENRPEWCIADLAIMAAGCVTVPAYVTNTERDHVHILGDSGARAVVVSTEKLSRPLLPAIMRTGIAEHVIPIDGIRQYQSGSLVCHAWSGMIEGNPAAARKAVDERLAGIGRADTACIIYTSGTGGAGGGGVGGKGVRGGARAGGGAPRLCGDNTCRSPWGRKSSTPRGWRSLPATSKRRVRRSWSSSRACSRCCASGS
jgi:long-chain acyl-CoA synthetase